jgi:hypothetical protein
MLSLNLKIVILDVLKIILEFYRSHLILHVLGIASGIPQIVHYALNNAQSGFQDAHLRLK